MEEGKGKEERKTRRVAWHTTSADRYTQPSVGTVSQPETTDPTPIRSVVINCRQSTRVNHATNPASTPYMRANARRRTPT